jgi:hypothetical protein
MRPNRRHHSAETAIEGRAPVWKKKILEIPIKWGRKAKPNVETGVIAFWLWAALSLFYGQSQPYSPVSILGKVTNNLEIFMQIKSGTRMLRSC